MDELSPRQVNLSDPFWSPRLEINARHAIFHQWEQLEASGCIDNFRIASGEKEGFREGWFFADSDAYKWLDAASRLLALDPDPKLAALSDDFVSLLARAQSPDGYLFTYNQIHFPGTRWVNLQIEHELYCHGHLIEAGASHYIATGRTNLLDIARRAADLVVRQFLGRGPEYTSGHEEIEIALLRLYRVTGHTPYLDMAQHFLEQRGRNRRFRLSLLRQYASVEVRRKRVDRERRAYQATHPEYTPLKLPAGNFSKHPPGITRRWYYNALSGRYFQQHAPIRSQTAPVGHAVRFGYLEAAIAMLYRLRPDATLLPALQRAWEHMVTRRMYVTGGIGSLPAVEGFGRDYELDPEYAYAETCAALASLFWNWEMGLISREAKYSDLFEWQLYNAAAVGMGLSGESYLYNNPLACRGGVTRKAWFAVPCCPSNLSRTWAELGKYIYSVDRDELWIHQYIGSQVRLNPGIPLRVRIESGLPYSGSVVIRLDPENPADFTLHLRIPSWSKATQITINGDPVRIPAVSPAAEPAAQGYDPRRSFFFPIRHTWSPGDIIEVTFDLAITLRHAHPRVKGHKDKVAITRGPLVYCLESVDNPGISLFTCRLNPATLCAEFDAGLLGGTWALCGETSDAEELTFIPYSLWANRGESRMVVWVKR